MNSLEDDLTNDETGHPAWIMQLVVRGLSDLEWYLSKVARFQELHGV
jgi:hypothetical protein